MVEKVGIVAARVAEGGVQQPDVLEAVPLIDGFGQAGDSFALPTQPGLLDLHGPEW
jgi:hypothetical protein